MADSESQGQVPDKADAVASKDEQAPKAAEKPKESKASVPTAAEAISEAMPAPAPSSKAPEANSSNVVASKDCAVLKKAKVHTVVGPKPVSMTESPISDEPMPTQANGKAVSESPSQVSNAEENPSSEVATKPRNYGEFSVVNSKPVPVSKTSESPSQTSNAKVKPSTAVPKKTDHAATKPGKLKASLVASSKLAPKSESSEPTPSRASEETAVLEHPEHTSKAKESPFNVVAKQTDHGVSAKPNASSVTGSKPVLVRVLQAQRKPVPSQASKMVAPDQAPKAEACPSNAVPKKTVRAPMSKEPKEFSVTGSKPIPTRVSRTGQPTLPQGSSVPDSKPIPVRVSQAIARAHHASLTPHKPAPSQKKQNIGDEFYEDASDVPLEEYCDDPSNEASQVERAVVLGAGREEPQQPSRDKEVATQLSDFKDVSDTPLTLYLSPQKSGNPVKPAQRHAGEGAAKKPLSKKKVIRNTAAVKKDEEKFKCAKAVEACRLPQQAAAKPKPVATNKVKAHLDAKQGAAKLTATATAPNSNLGANKRLLEPPGTPHQDAKKQKVDTSSEMSKPDPCASTTRQNGSPSPGKKLAAKKIKKAVSCTEVSAKLPIAGSNDAEALNNSTMLVPSTPQKNGSSLAVKKTEKVASCSKASTRPAMASSISKEMSKDSPMPAPKLEASKAVVGKSKKSEPTSTKTQPKTDAGHSSVTTPTHKKDSAKRKSTSPRKAPVTKSRKSTSPGKTAAMKLNKNPPTCAASKAKGKSHAPNGLPMTEGSPNPEGQTEAAAPAERPPQPPSSKATAKGHALSSEATSTKERSAMPAQHQGIPEVPETRLGKDDPAQKAGCSSTAEAAPVCAPSSDAQPGSSLKQCHASKAKESSSEATKTHKSFGGPAATPSKRETEAKGTPGLVTDGQPRYISQEPADGMKLQKTTPAENRCLDVPKESQSCDTFQASGIQKKTKAATTVIVGGIKGHMKNSGAPKKVEDWCDSPSTISVAPERKHSAKKLPTSGYALKTKNSMSKIIDKAVETTTGKEVPRKRTCGDAARTQYPPSKTTGKAAEATTDKDVLSKPTSGNAVTSKNSANGIVDKAAEATTHKEALGKSTSKDAVEARHPASEIVDEAAKRPTNKEALSTPLNVTCSSTLLSEHNMAENQADSLAGSKTAAASPHDGESLKQAREYSMVSSPSCDVLTDTNTPAVQKEDHTSGMLSHGTNSLNSPPDNTTLATGHCVSLGTSKGMPTFSSPLQKSACNKPSLTQQSDDSSASIIRQVSGCEQPRKENPVPLDPPAINEATKQGDGNESSACDNLSAQKPVEGRDSSQEPPPPSKDVDKRRGSTASTQESDEWTGEQSSSSPPRQTEADSPTTKVNSNGDAGDCKPDPHLEGLATSSHQDKMIKRSTPKKSNKKEGPGTNTSLRPSWLFSRKKRGKRQHSSTDTPSGSSPKKLKAADTSQGSSSSDSTGEPSARPIKKGPADDIDTEAMLPSVAPPGHCSNKKKTLCAEQASRSRDPKSMGNSAKRFKAADPSHLDLLAQGSSSKEFTGEPCISAAKKELGTEGVVDTEAIQNTPGKLRIPGRLALPVVQASDGSPKPARLAKSPAAGGKPSDPSSSSDGASASTPPTPYETALMELDMFTGLSILDVCGSGTETVAQMKEQLQVHSITKEQALGVVQEAVHKAFLDEYLKRERADSTLKLLAKIPFSQDPAKVAKIEQLTRAIVAMSEAGSKP